MLLNDVMKEEGVRSIHHSLTHSWRKSDALRGPVSSHSEQKKAGACQDLNPACTDRMVTLHLLHHNHCPLWKICFSGRVGLIIHNPEVVGSNPTGCWAFPLLLTLMLYRGKYCRLRRSQVLLQKQRNPLRWNEVLDQSSGAGFLSYHPIPSLGWHYISPCGAAVVYFTKSLSFQCSFFQWCSGHFLILVHLQLVYLLDCIRRMKTLAKNPAK